jgi:hypothetical protein
MFATADNVPYKRPSPGANRSGKQGRKISVSFTPAAFGGDNRPCQANCDANTKPYQGRSFGRLRDHPMDSERVSTAYVRGVLSLLNRQGHVRYADQLAFQGLPLMGLVNDLASTADEPPAKRAGESKTGPVVWVRQAHEERRQKPGDGSCRHNNLSCQGNKALSKASASDIASGVPRLKVR